LASDDVAARSRTVRQLRLICQHLKLDKNLPSLLAVPPAIYVTRQQDVEVAQLTDGAVELPAEVRGSRVHLGLQTPVDLRVLECFVDAGASVSVVIPGTREELIHIWQRSHGDAWMMHLASGLERAQEVSATPGFLESEPKWAQHYVMAKAFGLSRLFADQIKTRWTSFAIEGSAAAPGFHLRALDKVKARESERGFADVSGPPSEIPREAGVRERRLCAVLFADFRGIQKIADADLPRFRSLVLARLGQIVAAHGKKILLRKAWDDALHVVIADAATAAAIALEIQREILEIASRDKNAFSRLELRIALHFAPAFRGDDPFEDTQTWYGSELTFAARIEPVTPPGTVFVTEAFAARLIVEAPDQYRPEYAGELELAGSYGRSRLFFLRRP
jgi:class 3 adenylate cyclase